MAKEPKSLEDFGENAKQAIERTTRRAREAADSYFNFVKEAVSSLPSGVTDLGEKLKSYAETNIVATHEFVLKLSQAKDFQEVARIQSEFMKAQMEAFGEHTKILAGEFTKAATGAIKTPTKKS
jgi:hypothetical protein